MGDCAKDDFKKIKNILRDGIISAQRVPPQILVLPTDNKVSTTYNLDKVVNFYNSNVIRLLQNDLMDEINDHLAEDLCLPKTSLKPRSPGICRIVG